MSWLGTLIRRMLSRRGITLSRSLPEIPPTLSGILESIRQANARPVGIVCFDSEVRVQSEILALFPPDQVQFASLVKPLATGSGVPVQLTPVAPAGPFIAMVDLASTSWPELVARLPWLVRAETLLLRCPLGLFWSGEIDLCNLTSDLQKRGFGLDDVIDLTVGSQLEAASARPTFVFRAAAHPVTPSRNQHYRVNQALALLSAPIAQPADFHLLTGRGSHGFAGGVFNPGAIVEDDCIHLLCRTERHPWKQMKGDESLYFSPTPALLLKLDGAGAVSQVSEIAPEGLPAPATTRAEDFRLFRFRGEIYSNHSVVSASVPGTPARRPLQLEKMQTRVGLSRLDLATGRLSWCGLPELGRPLGQTEKNWAMFADANRLFLLYSFSPYILFSSRNWPGLEFAPLLETQVNLPFGGDGLPVRNSINPVVYDAGHWLHLVHKVYPDKRYAFWAVLIDRQSLLPVRATRRPLVHGWQSNPASILYTSSVVVRETEILLCTGLDDCATSIATIPRQKLDAEWVTLGQTKPPT